MFTFDNFVCVGDSSTAEIEGYTITATVEFDQDTRPDDFDCYTEEQIQAWRGDEWYYGGIVLSVAYNGVPLLEHAASLWGIDINLGDDNNYLADVALELVPEALKEAQEARGRIMERLAA